MGGIASSVDGSPERGVLFNDRCVVLGFEPWVNYDVRVVTCKPARDSLDSSQGRCWQQQRGEQVRLLSTIYYHFMVSLLKLRNQDDSINQRYCVIEVAFVDVGSPTQNNTCVAECTDFQCLFEC